MKKLFPYLVAFSLAGSALAGPLQFTAATIQTNNSPATTVQTPDDLGFVNGWIESVTIDITAGQMDTNTVTLYTLAGGGFGASRTILTISDIAGDGTWPVRDLVTTQAGSDISDEPARIALYGDKLRLTAIGGGSDTNTAATFTLYVTLAGGP